MAERVGRLARKARIWMGSKDELDRSRGYCSGVMRFAGVAHERCCMLSARPDSTVESIVNDGSRLPGPMGVQKQLAKQPHPRVLVFASSPREGGRIPPASVMIAQALFFFSLALHLLGPASTRLCKREMQKFQALGPSSLGQASFFPHIIRDPPSTLWVPRVQLIYLAFSALPHAPHLARSFQASWSIIKMIIVITRRVDIYRNSPVP